MNAIAENMNNLNTKVDEFINDSDKWNKEFTELRKIILDCGLEEEFKWRQPCYVLGRKNIVIMHGFRDYCALLFFKGSLLKDDHGMLIQQTENVQAARQIRFSGIGDITGKEQILKSYIRQAIEVEKAGFTVKLKETSQYKMPEEFRIRLNTDPELKKAFEALTPGRQRAYLFYFSSPKLSRTRESRVENCTYRILSGKGLND